MTFATRRLSKRTSENSRIWSTRRGTCRTSASCWKTKTIDAVSIAMSPNHWHAGMMAVWAMQAGKEALYVEKPCSHNVREGAAS